MADMLLALLTIQDIALKIGWLKYCTQNGTGTTGLAAHGAVLPVLYAVKDISGGFRISGGEPAPAPSFRLY